MLGEGETELRDLVIKNLDTCGFLNKIKAELRAGVFLALNDEGNLRKKIPKINEKLDDFSESNEGKLALSIVREFLECFGMNFTISVFEPELGNTSPFLNRKELCKKLHLDEADCEDSVLSALLKQKSQSKSFDSFAEKPKQFDTISEDFSFKKEIIKIDHTKAGDSYLIPAHTSSKNENHNSVNQLTSKTDISSSSDSKNISPQTLTKSKLEDDIFNFTKVEQKYIFKSDSSHDPFFDEPIPPEKSNFLHLSTLGGLSESNKFLTSSDKSGLSSLRDLPSLKKPSDLFNKENADSIIGSDIFNKKEFDKKDLDPESNEESSERQIISEESIEEEIEDDISVGLDDILNSSLSMGEDVTSDQTVSQASVVEGVDHIESCNSVN